MERFVVEEADWTCTALEFWAELRERWSSGRSDFERGSKIPTLIKFLVCPIAK
jgi:hypothetical protein